MAIDQIPLNQVLIVGDKDAIGFFSLLVAYIVWWIMEHVWKLLQQKEEEQRFGRISIQDNNTFASLRLSPELDTLSDGTGSSIHSLSQQEIHSELGSHGDGGDLEKGDSIGGVAEKNGMQVVRELAMLYPKCDNDDVLKATPQSFEITPYSSPTNSPPRASPSPTTGQLRKAPSPPKIVISVSDVIRPLQPRRGRRSPFLPMICRNKPMKDSIQNGNGDHRANDGKENSIKKAIDGNGVELIRDLAMLFASYGDEILQKHGRPTLAIKESSCSSSSTASPQQLSPTTTGQQQRVSSPQSVLIESSDDESVLLLPPPSVDRITDEGRPSLPIICMSDDPVMKEKVPNSTVEERHRFLNANQNNVVNASRALQQYLDWADEHRVIREVFEKELQLQECNEQDDAGERNVLSDDEKIWELSAAVAVRSRREKNQDVKLPQVAAIYQLHGQDVRDHSGYRVLKLTPGRMDDRLADLKTYGLAVALYLDMKLPRNSLELLTILMDARGGRGWRNNNGPRLLPFLRYVSGLLLVMFPERLARFVVYPVPESFLWIWSLVGTWFDSLTRERVELVPGESKIVSPIPKEGLSKFVDPEIVDLIEEKRVADFVDEPETNEQACSQNKGWHISFLS